MYHNLHSKLFISREREKRQEKIYKKLNNLLCKICNNVHVCVFFFENFNVLFMRENENCLIPFFIYYFLMLNDGATNYGTAGGIIWVILKSLRHVFFGQFNHVKC